MCLFKIIKNIMYSSLQLKMILFKKKKTNQNNSKIAKFMVKLSESNFVDPIPPMLEVRASYTSC